MADETCDWRRPMNKNYCSLAAATHSKSRKCLSELVSMLDQPLRHVEIEAQFVQVFASELKQFGISTDAATADARRGFKARFPWVSRATIFKSAWRNGSKSGIRQSNFDQTANSHYQHGPRDFAAQRPD